MSTTETTAERDDAMSRRLLACGIVATPLFYSVTFIQASTRDGYELGPHVISQLSTGDGGWVQVANFVGAGILFVLAAIGARRAVPRDRRWLPRLLAVFGGGLIAAGVFVTDPMNGYPAGAPDTTTWSGTVHLLAAAVNGLALMGALAVEVRRSVAQREPVWATAGVLVALLNVLLPALGPAEYGLTIALASMIGWGWLGILLARLRQSGDTPFPRAQRSRQTA